MKSETSLIIALLIGLTSSIFASSKGEVKNSPLFKASLKSSIAKLEGEINIQTLNTTRPGEISTSKPGCVTPNARETQLSTCEPSYCGSSETCMLTSCYGSTCYSTCNSTCGSQSTCQSTCQNTCTNTCQWVACPYHYIWRGTNYWNYNGLRSSEWSALNYHSYRFNYGATNVSVYDPQHTSESTGWISDGHYSINKWYANAINSKYDIISDAYLISSLGSRIQRGVLYSESAPDSTGHGKDVEILFYD
jgi:hypothetical protein